MTKRAWMLGSGILAACGLLLAAPPAAPKPFKAYDAQAKAILAKMTLDEKIGQMTQPDCTAIKDVADVSKFFLGSVLSGGSSDPKAGNSLKAWTDHYEAYQKEALKTRLAIPILYGIDAVHGNNNLIGAVQFPHNIGLGCTRNPALIEKIAFVTAKEVRASGVNWGFSPCVTVPQDIRWGRTYEGFSEEPSIVKELGGAATRGLQGYDLTAPTSLLGSAKHYVGDGGTTMGSGDFAGRMLDQGDTRVDEATLRKIHLQGYYTAIKEGVGTIMPSYSRWNGVKCSASKQLLTDILKTEMGFDGFLISDYNALDQVDKDFKKAVEISINAGMDMVMITNHWQRYIALLKELVNEGRVPMSRIDDAVTRILRVKIAMGMMDGKAKLMSNPELVKDFGGAEHRAVARQAVRESLVLLKNEKKTLPLKKSAAHVAVVGVAADDLGIQCGGWTIDWQGKAGQEIVGGTSLLKAVQGAVSKATKVTFSKDGAGIEGATAAIVVVGEKPYAEGFGDKKSLQLSAEDQALIAKVKATGVSTTVVILSGRPLVLGEAFDKADAVVAAWLPGSEGQGMTDVLFGDFKPKGKLSYAWPKSDEQIGRHPGDAGYDPVFKLGFGLSW